MADPEGFLTIKIANKENIFFYQMGHKTSDRPEINVSTQTPEERILGRMSRWMPFEIIYVPNE